MPKNSDKLAASLDTENTGGLLSGFLAEEEHLDRRAMLRLGTWGAASVGAVIVAVLANQSQLGLRREQVAAVDLARQSQQIQSIAKESQNETRRLASAIDTLNSDRDRLYSRVTVLEQGLDSVTGSIARQSAAAATQPTPAPSPVASAATPSAATPALSPAPASAPPAQNPAPAPVAPQVVATATPATVTPAAVTPPAAPAEKPRADVKPQDKPTEKVQEKNQEKSQDKNQEKAQDKAQEKVQAQEKTQEKTQEKSQEKPPEKSVEKQPEPTPTAVASATPASPAPAATPAAPLIPSKSMMGPPDPAAPKLIEPTPAPAKADATAPAPEVVASAPPADKATSNAGQSAPPQLAVQRTEFGVDVGGANSVPGLRALWRGLLKWRSNAALKALQPIIVVKEGNNGLGMQLRLVAGPLTDAAAAAKICAAMVESQRPCETTVFDGQRLAMKNDDLPTRAADEPDDKPAATKPASGRSTWRRRGAPKHVVVEEDPPKKPESSTLSSFFNRH